jgi:hypothetical protein
VFIKNSIEFNINYVCLVPDFSKNYHPQFIQGISRVIMSPAVGGIENATHNTLEHKPGHGGDKYPAFLLMYYGLHFLFRRAHYHS